jgi:hypothetical protein
VTSQPSFTSIHNSLTSGASSTVVSSETVIGILSSGRTNVLIFTQISTTSNSSIPVSSPTSTPPHQIPSLQKSSLNPGAKAGIGVSVTLFAILLGISAFLFVRRRSRYKSDEGKGHDARNAVQNRFITPGMAGGSFSIQNPSSSVPQGSDIPTSASTSQLPVIEDHTTITSRSISGRASRKQVVPEAGLEIPEAGLEVVEQADQPSPPPINVELAWLREEQVRLQERRQTLLMVQALDEEERRIRRRIMEIEQSGQASSTT